MKKVTFLLAIAAIMSFTVADQAVWKLDKSHAKLGFSITHLMLSDVEGSFKNVDATIISSKEDFSDAVINLTADVNSINTDDDKRDTHLKSPDFFEVAKYPTLTFKSKSFTKVAGKAYKLTGDLTLHGITKTVVLDVTFNGIGVHPYTKKSVAGFKIKGTINRSDFGIGTKFPSAMLSDEVEIDANAEFIKD